MNVNEIAAEIHKRMCEDNRFGYSQGDRWGQTAETWTIDGKNYTINVGDYDCSSSTITAWKLALSHTSYAGKLDSATYTGNMRSVFVNSGAFEWKPISYIAASGDLYLNETSHVAMCQTQTPDVLSEFSINENGGITGGKQGDQTGNEAHLASYYNFPWDGILHYKGTSSSTSSSTTSSSGDSSAIHFRVCTNSSGKNWLSEMWGSYDTGGSSDDYAGNAGTAIRWVAIKGVSKYQVAVRNGSVVTWLPYISGYDINDLENGCAGNGSPIVGLRVNDSKVRYKVHVIGAASAYAEMIGLTDTGKTSDDYAGDLYNSIDKLYMDWA